MPPASNLGAVRRYTQTYQYDKVDNLLKMKHLRSTGGGWTRTYSYGTDASNKLLSNSIGGNTYTYSYDAHGNMIGMPHLQALNWNFQDQLQAVELLGGGGTAYYNYDASGQRVRKVVAKSNKREERLYLGGVERYREYHSNGNIKSERWTLQVEGIAQVDTQTVDNNSAILSPVPAIRYQYKDHLGSATLETDENGDVISYEEYHPFGTSAYRVEKSGTNLSLKRYRFTNKERDDETGLYYFGVRYYAAWLGRWTSADPGGLVDGLNLYQYGRNNPVKLVDEEGFSAEPPPDCPDCPEPEFSKDGQKHKSKEDGKTYEFKKIGDTRRWVAISGGAIEISPIKKDSKPNIKQETPTFSIPMEEKPVEEQSIEEKPKKPINPIEVDSIKVTSIPIDAQRAQIIPEPIIDIATKFRYIFQGGIFERLEYRNFAAKYTQSLGQLGTIPTNYRISFRDLSGFPNPTSHLYYNRYPKVTSAWKGLRLDFGPMPGISGNHWHWNHSGAGVFNIPDHTNATRGATRFGQIMKYAKPIGRASLATGITLDFLDLSNEISKSRETGDYRNSIQKGAEIAGGWGSAWLGGKALGSLLGTIGFAFGGPIGGGIGALVGGVVGGIIGYFAGSSLGKWVGSFLW